MLIELTQGQVTEIDEIDSDLANFKWSARFGSGYAEGGSFVAIGNKRQIDGSYKTEYLHRTILSRSLNRELKRCEIVDHIDHDTLNNKRSNLRLATFGNNCHNARKRKDNTSGYKGVGWRKDVQKWHAQISHNGKKIHLGNFDNVIRAAEVYDQKAKELFGEFAVLNFP